VSLISVNRCLIPDLSCDRVEIHAFSDTSSEAYAVAVYLRVVFNNSVCVNFIAGKSKIALFKESLTIPKLELIAACLSVRLVQIVLKELRLESYSVFYWVDAVSVLHLVYSEDKRYKIFVANRLALIRLYSSPNQRHFCPTAFKRRRCGHAFDS